jgi:hypothetical protein
MRKIGQSADEGGPFVVYACGCRGSVKSRDGLSAGRHVVEHALCRRWSDALHQLHDTKSGDAIGKAKKRQQILDVRSIEELEAAEFYERDIAARQLDLERSAVMRGAEQHGLLFESRSAFTIFESRTFASRGG